MSKDVIYIEPEDDITDVISRIKSSSEKILAIVPPKKLGIMRSAVNVKLIAKTAKNEDKAAVIITTDPSLIKLAAFSGLSTAKTLNSRPMLPSEFTNRKKQETEEFASDELAADELDQPAEDDSNEAQIINEKPKKKVEKKDDDATTILEQPKKSEKKPKKKTNKLTDKLTDKIPNFEKYRKFIIPAAVGGAALIVLIIWMFIIAPHVKIVVKMKTSTASISENVSLVTSEKEKNNTEGKFLLEQIKYEEEASIEFNASGKDNKGEKASGTVSVIAKLDQDGNKSVTIPAGTAFTNGSRKYNSTEAVTFTLDGEDLGECENKSSVLKENYCRKSAKVKITAAESGADYNISSTSSNWQVSVRSISVIGSTDMIGGTDKNVSVVTEKDLDDAKTQLKSSDNFEEAKKKLYDQIGDSVVKIEPSFKVEVSNEKSNFKKGDEVKDGDKPKMTAKVIYTIYAVDRAAIEEYITAFEKDKMAEGDRIYSFGNPFFERYLEEKDGNFSAKLKTSAKIGPEISETSILETAKGKKVGEVKALVKDMSSNITEVNPESNFPWVSSVPSDPNKVEVKIEVDNSDDTEEK
jgi:hypothetical protein